MRRVTRHLPAPLRRRLHDVATSARAAVRRRRRARWGNLRRSKPFSDTFGDDRGTPIDHFYLDRYLAAHADDITGRVLETRWPAFTNRHGRDVSALDIVDRDPANLSTTVLADVAEPGSLPAASWDCIVAPHLLNVVDDPAAALANLWQSLRPGGVLLVSAPSVARPDPGRGPADRWRFLPAGLEQLLQQACPGGAIGIQGYGNLVTSTAYHLGLAAEELDPRELDRDDPSSPLLVCGRVERSAAA